MQSSMSSANASRQPCCLVVTLCKQLCSGFWQESASPSSWAHAVKAGFKASVHQSNLRLCVKVFRTGSLTALCLCCGAALQRGCPTLHKKGGCKRKRRQLMGTARSQGALLQYDHKFWFLLVDHIGFACMRQAGCARVPMHVNCMVGVNECDHCRGNSKAGASGTRVYCALPQIVSVQALQLPCSCSSTARLPSAGQTFSCWSVLGHNNLHQTPSCRSDKKQQSS